MKGLLYLFLLAFLFQSCFSYKAVDPGRDNLALEKRYRIKLKDECMKVDLVAVGDSTFTVLQYNKNREIRKGEVRKMESRKFSLAKTILLPVGIVAFIVGLAALSFN